jgi:predicted lipid-binding transport protein (Tim44 family)
MDMGASSGFPIDLILFGMIAAFLVLRLRGILGRRTGFERPPQAYQPPAANSPAAAPVIDGLAEPVVSATSRSAPDPSSPVGKTLVGINAIDQSFNTAGFLTGAEKAFRMIVAAFANGDRATLRSLLADDTYLAFEQAIGAREAAGHVQVSEIRAIPSLTIEDAELRGSMASIMVRIVSDQVSFAKDQNGQPVVGAEAVTEITDIWTFERDLSTPDLTWRLTSARSA